LLTRCEGETPSRQPARTPALRKVRDMFRIWPWFLILALTSICMASVQSPSSSTSSSLRQAVLVEREHQVWKTPKRAAEFSDIPHVSARSRCEDTQPPQALTTPDPMLLPAAVGAKVKVSFIVGADGRVHSLLILQSAGPVGDRNVLRTVRTWRYRPATCNGVPTEAEGKIEFSRR
jgi:TonB family protein